MDMAVDSWAREEVGAAAVHDERLVKRLIKVTTDMAEHPGMGMPTVYPGDRAGSEAAYRLLNNPAVTAAGIDQSHAQATVRRLAEQRLVLVLQDTTPLDFTTTRVPGLGYLSGKRRGLLQHTALAVGMDGVPLGILDRAVWARPHTEGPVAATRRKRAIADKESARWLESEQRTLALVPEHVDVVTVADREGDIFEWFVAPRRPGAALLVRLAHDRVVDEDVQHLMAATVGLAPMAKLDVAIPLAPGRAARTAHCTLSWTTLTVAPPRNLRGRERLTSLALSVVVLQEEPDSLATEPVRWVLATTLPITTAEEAAACVAWYRLRWRIEEWHNVLKQACRVEYTVQHSLEAITTTLALSAIIAWRTLVLKRLAELQPALPCTVLFLEVEWQTLWLWKHRGQALPSTPPPLLEMVCALGHLGGYVGGRQRPIPGTRSLAKGFARLNDLICGRSLPHPSLL